MTFQEAGERFSFFPGEKAGMRASVQTILVGLHCVNAGLNDVIPSGYFLPALSAFAPLRLCVFALIPFLFRGCCGSQTRAPGQSSALSPGGAILTRRGKKFASASTRPVCASPETPENRQNLPLDGVASVWQHQTIMSGTQKQFSLTRAAHEYMRTRKKTKFLSIHSNGGGL